MDIKWISSICMKCVSINIEKRKEIEDKLWSSFPKQTSNYVSRESFKFSPEGSSIGIVDKKIITND